MARDNYLWLAALATISARLENRRASESHDDDDTPIVTQITALAGVIRQAEQAAANDLVAFLIGLCQCAHKFSLFLPRFAQILSARPISRFPSEFAAFQAF